MAKHDRKQRKKKARQEKLRQEKHLIVDPENWTTR